MAVNWTARALTGALTIVFMTQPGFALASPLAGKPGTPCDDDRPVAFDATGAATDSPRSNARVPA